MWTPDLPAGHANLQPPPPLAASPVHDAQTHGSRQPPAAWRRLAIATSTLLRPFRPDHLGDLCSLCGQDRILCAYSNSAPRCDCPSLGRLFADPAGTLQARAPLPHRPSASPVRAPCCLQIVANEAGGGRATPRGAPPLATGLREQDALWHLSLTTSAPRTVLRATQKYTV